MNRRLRLATAAALAGIACVSGASAQDPAFRQVLLEPVAVAYRPGWLRDVNLRRALSERFTAPEAARLADDLGQELQASLAEAFRARGLATASRPEEGVLRVAGRIESLDVHAPGLAPPGGRTYIREAGSATIVLEAREAASGRFVRQYREPATTGRIGDDFVLAGPVTTHAQFAALLRRSAEDFASSLAAP